MGYILVALSFFLLGVICCPLLIFIRAKRDGSWDDSNITNIYRVVAHLATHPSDFARMVYDDDVDVHPFWYINKDELSEVVKTRPKDY